MIKCGRCGGSVKIDSRQTTNVAVWIHYRCFKCNKVSEIGEWFSIGLLALLFLIIVGWAIWTPYSWPWVRG